jgi:hypothetical protein
MIINLRKLYEKFDNKILFLLNIYEQFFFIKKIIRGSYIII